MLGWLCVRCRNIKQMLKTPVAKSERKKKAEGSPKQNGLDEVTGDKETRWQCGMEELW